MTKTTNDSTPALTPMMRQYRAAKAEIPPDAILLFRLGDFYEMFFEDAARASGILELVLTKRAGVPMCGFPFHALDTQLPRLLAAGVKVAIAEQLEDPKLAQGLVKRAVTRIITPGTVVDATALQPERNNFLLALAEKKDQFALASLDLSTGEFRVTVLETPEAIEAEIHRLGARELLLPANRVESWQEAHPVGKLLCTALDEWIFATDVAEDYLKRHFNVLSLDGFGCRDLPLAVSAAGAVLYYATENLRQSASHVNKLQLYHPEEALELDVISQRNLELVEPMFGSEKSHTLLAVLNCTSTPWGVA